MFRNSKPLSAHCSRMFGIFLLNPACPDGKCPTRTDCRATSSGIVDSKCPRVTLLPLCRVLSPCKRDCDLTRKCILGGRGRSHESAGTDSQDLPQLYTAWNRRQCTNRQDWIPIFMGMTMPRLTASCIFPLTAPTPAHGLPSPLQAVLYPPDRTDRALCRVRTA